ncbi:MAG: glycosyltransferase family 39 protein [Clostridia bacterium]|nr:glycosyltransferase family 39 protein [Clostridia bacterium]
MQAKQHSSSLKGASFTRILHFAVIFIGAVLYISSAFFDSVWFDEAYTVGAVSKTLPEMIYLLAYDVHPHLYYVLLKVYSLIFGNSVITLRMFSVIFAIASTILGYTHIRKDFGEKAGFWFSFLLVFSFSTLKYALQIRMYTLAIFLLTLTAVYAYRYIKNGDKLSRVLYLAFSIL